MIISIDVEKSSEKIQHSFMTKTLQKVGIEGTYLNKIKAICDKPTANIIVNREKLKTFPLRSGIRQGCPLTLTTFFQHSIGGLSHSNQRRKMKGIQIENEEVKLSLSADEMMLYIERPKDATRKILKLINEFGKVAGYKINVQKSVAFLYTNNELSEREIKETIPFTITSKE